MHHPFCVKNYLKPLKKSYNHKKIDKTTANFFLSKRKYCYKIIEKVEKSGGKWVKVV